MRTLLVFALMSAFLTIPLAAQPRVDFVRDIRPILAGSCFLCHGPDEKSRMANLRLDTRDGAHAAITSGKLLERIASTDPPRRMPLGGQLKASQIELIRNWIAQGAEWEAHWAFVAPKRPDVPAVNGAANPIDRFILTRLAKENLPPSPTADKTTLIRRVTLDLTGLPPTLAEVDAFLGDHSAGAYEKVVDRLLRSPHYGERMAVPWLDLARYADTHGYHIDSHRDMWPWRDWVIDAFNRNLPYDQFTVWQVAGDLLPNATREQRLATGFNRNHMINYEGGAIPEEYQVEYVVDRVEATSNTWLGLTMGCARCHDHKYDPIKQREFYQFYAFFNTVKENGLDGKKGNAEPLLRLDRPEQEATLANLDAKLKDLDQSLAPAAITSAQAAWERTKLAAVAATQSKVPREGLLAHYEFDNNLSDSSGHYQTGRVTAGEVTYPDGPVGRAVAMSGDTRLELLDLPDSGPFTVAGWIRSNSVQEMSILDAPRLSMRFTESRPLPRLRRASRLVVRANGVEIRTRDPIVMSGQDGSSPWHYYAVGVDGSKITLLVDGEPVEVGMTQAPAAPSGGMLCSNHFQGQIDDLRIYKRALTPGEMDELVFDEPIRAILWSGPAPDKRSSMQKAQMREYFLTREAPEELRSLYAKRNALKQQRDRLEASIPTTMVMAEQPLTGKDKPRESFVLARGDYRNQTEKVTADVPAALPPLPANAPRNRLTLARWLVDPQNPLTARVAVNRFWQMYFGTGLVKTSEDFGTRGELPSHPELLDWLATDFVRTGWDVRAMQRLIVTSATYRQSARATPAALARDPENRLLARGPRFRLPAEMIRDNALAASGLLNTKLGGSSVYPYQPPGIWEEISFGDVYSAQYYSPSHGEDLYRRSIYTFWKRTAPPPLMSVFDAPDRQKCTARRSNTNTPLQALALMNDPTYVEASRALASRVMLAAK